jgi:hypothetical protein
MKTLSKTGSLISRYNWITVFASLLPLHSDGANRFTLASKQASEYIQLSLTVTSVDSRQTDDGCMHALPFFDQWRMIEIVNFNDLDFFIF